MKFSGSNLSPRTVLLSTFSHRSSRVAYTRRKSVWYFRSPSVRSARLGCLPHGPGLHPRPDDEQARPAAVVGPLRPVLLHPPAELGERHEQACGASSPVRWSRWNRPADRLVDLLEERLLRGGLPGVRVEPVDRHVEDARAEPLLDQPADEVELGVQAAGPEPGPGRVAGLVLEDRLELLDRRVRLQVPALDERRAGRRRSRRARRRPRPRSASCGPPPRRCRAARASSSNGCSWLMVNTPWVVPRQASGSLSLPTCMTGTPPPLPLAGRGRSGQPAGPAHLGGHLAGLPDVHRLEVRAVRVRVADALHDGELALLEQLLADLLEGRVQADAGRSTLMTWLGWMPRVGRSLWYRSSRVRDDGVEPVVAAGQLDDDEDGVLARLGGAGRARRGSRARRRRVATSDERLQELAAVNMDWPLG